MDEHTPQHPTPLPEPTVDPRAEVDPTQVDLVAGDPPVPITVWRTARTPADAGRGISTRLAARLITAYSRPDEMVVDLTDDHALTDACVAGARRHHPAWFTDASSIIVGPTTPAPAAETTGGGTAGDAEEEDLPELGAWFGDDLTDPYLPPPAGPVADLPSGGALSGATSLVVARWPLDAVDAANRVRLAWLLTACARLLRPGGCLILVVAVPAGTTAAPEDFSGVVSATAGVGLAYLQHIVAVTADTDGDAFVYHATDEELLTLAGTTGRQWQVAHLHVHADLLVFSRPQAQHRVPPRWAGRAGGGRRG